MRKTLILALVLNLVVGSDVHKAIEHIQDEISLIFRKPQPDVVHNFETEIEKLGQKLMDIKTFNVPYIRAVQNTESSLCKVFMQMQQEKYIKQMQWDSYIQQQNQYTNSIDQTSDTHLMRPIKDEFTMTKLGFLVIGGILVYIFSLRQKNCS